jgi:hypothetical protein
VTDRRDIGRDDTQPPVGNWDGIERRRPVSEPTRDIAEEALREVRTMHRALHGEGDMPGVFEQLRSVIRSQSAMQVSVDGFDHKLDEALRLAKEELRLREEMVLLERQQAQAAVLKAARKPPLWLSNSGLASLVAIAVFFVVRLWHEVFGR